MMIDMFLQMYEPAEKEFIILCKKDSTVTSDGDFCKGVVELLAYIDVDTRKIYRGGYLVWPVRKADKLAGKGFNYFSASETYRVKIRKQLPSEEWWLQNNEFYVTEILGIGIQINELDNIRAEYEKPVIIHDEVLGELVLNKRYKTFSGKFKWQGRTIEFSFKVENIRDPENWQVGINSIRQIFLEQMKWDSDMRIYAAQQLTELANEWREEEDEDEEITEKSFINRIHLFDFVMNDKGCFTAYFSDDDMFAGHAITVEGSIRTGFTEAHIVG